MKKTLLIALLATTMTVPNAYSASSARNGATDNRIKTFVYDEHEVYRIKGYYGYSTTLQFSKKEQIESINLGDSVAWSVTPLKSHRNIMMIKPLLENAHSNMTVITDKRIYSFELSAAKSNVPWNGRIAYRLMFKYPQEQDMLLANFADQYPRQKASEAVISENVSPDAWNLDYTFSGSKTLHPVRTFDDGKFTYFQFSDIETTPAIFLVDEDGKESLINFTRKGKYIVVERLGRQFTLRDGDDVVACIFNESFPERKADPLSPAIISDQAERPAQASDEIIVEEHTKDGIKYSTFPARYNEKKQDRD